MSFIRYLGTLGLVAYLGLSSLSCSRQDEPSARELKRRIAKLEKEAESAKDLMASKFDRFETFMTIVLPRIRQQCENDTLRLQQVCEQNIKELKNSLAYPSE